jgi:hypothetical protein
MLDAKIVAHRKGINGLDGIIRPMHLNEKEKEINKIESYKRRACECDAIVAQIHSLVSNHLNVDYVSGVNRTVFEKILNIIDKGIK